MAKRIQKRDGNGVLRYEHLRVCECGDEKWVSYKPNDGTLCGACSRKLLGFAMSQNNHKNEKDKIFYTRKCVDCDGVRTDLKARPSEPQLCSDCSKKRTGVGAVKDDFAPPRITVAMDSGKSRTMWLRTCSGEGCGESAYVSFKPKKTSLCRSCSRKATESKVVKKPKKAKKVVKTSRTVVSKEAIEKVREINRKHKEEVKVVKVVKQRLSDDEMIARYLDTHTVAPAVLGDLHYTSPMISSEF